jgi:hypothetical protein
MNCNGRTALSKYHGWITVVMRNHPEAGVRFRNQPGVTDPGQPGSPRCLPSLDMVAAFYVCHLRCARGSTCGGTGSEHIVRASLITHCLMPLWFSAAACGL